MRPDTGSRPRDTAADLVSIPSTSETVILCDGIGCEGYVWKYLRPALSRHYRVIHWHYRGHGRTPMPRNPARITIPDHADDLACVLDELQVERAVLLGHSMGVQVALETFRRHRPRVSALVLMCGAPGEPLTVSMASQRRAEMLLATLRKIVRRAPWLFNGLARTLLPTDLAYTVATWLEVDDERLARDDFMPYLQGMAQMDVGLFLDILNAANEHSAVDILHEIDVPVLVVGGSADGFTSPVLSEKMYTEIPDAEMWIIDRGSHTAPLECPDAVCETVLDFLRRRLI